MKNIFGIAFAIAFGLSLSWAIFSLAGERLAWYVADRATKGLIRLEDYVIESKLRTGLMNYETLTVNMANKLSDPGYTFEQFKNDEHGKLNYELQIIHVGQRIIDSYKQSEG